MAVIEIAGGDLIITVPNCDCGLAGGCEKCQMRILRKTPEQTPEIIYPPPPVRKLGF